MGDALCFSDSAWGARWDPVGLESRPLSPLLPGRQISALRNHSLCVLPRRQWRLQLSREQSLQNIPSS